MSYMETIQADLKAAMLNKESEKVKTLRMIISKLREKKIAMMKDLDEAEELAVLKKAVKERQDSMTTYTAAGRDDLAAIENGEMEFIMTYLPAEMDDAALEMIVRQTISDTGATSMADMGRVMGAVMKEVNGRADGKRVREFVIKHLGA